MAIKFPCVIHEMDPRVALLKHQHPWIVDWLAEQTRQCDTGRSDNPALCRRCLRMFPYGAVYDCCKCHVAFCCQECCTERPEDVRQACVGCNCVHLCPNCVEPQGTWCDECKQNVRGSGLLFSDIESMERQRLDDGL